MEFATSIKQRKEIRQGLLEKYKHKLIDGRAVSAEIRNNIKNKINDIQEINVSKFHDRPMLGYIIVGNKPESSLYVKLKTQAADDIGIEHQGRVLSENVSEQ